VTQAFSAGLGWLVKLDKEDFAGKPELLWQSKREDGMRLVGLQPTDPDLVPAEASQIISADGRIEGRVTSSRYSPTLERSICLGLVSARLSSPGTTVTIQLPDGSQATACVMEHLAHFDPEGTRLRV
jgi:sarcosine oxidase subunit alpha